MQNGTKITKKGKIMICSYKMLWTIYTSYWPTAPVWQIAIAFCPYFFTQQPTLSSLASYPDWKHFSNADGREQVIFADLYSFWITRRYFSQL